MPMDQNEQLYKSHPLHSSAMEGHHHVQQTPPSVPFGYGNQSAGLAVSLADQPLEFVQKFKGDRDPQIHSSYAHPRPLGPGGGVDSTSAVPPIHSWAPPLAPDTVYPPMPPVLPPGPQVSFRCLCISFSSVGKIFIYIIYDTGTSVLTFFILQHDPTIATPSTVSGHASAPFGSFPGPGFQTSIASTGTPFGLGAAPGIHPTAAFPGDAYGAPERPKKVLKDLPCHQFL